METNDLDLAVALAVINTKPDNFSTEEHVEMIRANLSKHLEDESFSKSEEKIKDDASFIAAMLKLRFAVKCKQNVHFRDVKFLTPNNQKKVDIENSSNDSDEEISSVLYRHITHSSETEATLDKCLLSVLKYLYNLIKHKSEEIYRTWKSSIFKYIFDVLKISSIDANCKDKINFFLQEIISLILQNQTGTQIEYQFALVNELCCNNDSCFNVVSIAMSELERLCVLLAEETKEEIIFNSVEKCPHLLNFIIDVLKKWKIFKRKLLPNQQIESFDIWTVCNESGDQDLEFLKKFKNLCELHTGRLNNKFPLAAFQLWDLRHSIIELIDAFTETLPETVMPNKTDNNPPNENLNYVQSYEEFLNK